MLWRLLFIALIGGAKFIQSDRCPDSVGELIQTTVWRSSSSTVSNSHPERAIDGNTNTCATITSHSPDKSAWWKVQLSGVYQVSCVSIYSKDQNGTSMTRAPVQIRIRSYNNGINKKICTKMTHFKGGEWNNFTCAEQVSGRNVTVSLQGTRPLILCEVKIYGKRKDLINTTNSITSQSSNYIDDDDFSYSSGRATDGDEKECAHTEPKRGNHWWRIELPGIYDISGISIYNTKEDNTNMNGAQIHIGNSRQNNRINNKICANMTPFIEEQWNNYTCAEQVSGRYITVSLQRRMQLILCEVKIYGKRKDLINTTNSITSQSSNYTHDVQYSSVKATDRDKTACARTEEKQGDHWWRIDLLGVYDISCVSIYNKIGHDITMTGAQIHIGNSRENNGTNNKICANMRPFNKGQWNNYTCTEQVSGRYVTVSFPEKKALILCEVKIYGKRKASPFKLIKKNKTWEHALEYCRGKDMDLATILDEDDQTLAELEARKADTPFLWLGLHYTCILEVWFWVADHRLEFNRWAPGEKTGDCDRSAVMERAEGHKWFSKSDYAEFNFICQKF
uniref:C-type lectin domain-containing protein n=1 Tax=Sparus aurata TaxID=8175 RepID=A0A671Z354_SPAAU